LWQLIRYMLRLGTLGFGGPVALVGYMHRDVVEDRQWMPQSAGLYALSLGLSKNFSDDHEMLKHGMVMYDALFAWCQHCQAETHHWPPAIK
jgi:hypothetical protein